MNISLITTKPSMAEHQRIAAEAANQGHDFTLINVSDFSYQIQNNHLTIPHLSDHHPHIAIFRAIFNHIKTFVPIADHLRQQGVKIFDNNLLKHTYSIHKITDLVKFANAQLPQPYTLFAPHLDDYLSYIHDLPYPVILKLTRTGKGAGIYKADSPDQLRQVIAQQHQNGHSEKPFLLQQFIPYIHDLRILIIGDHVFAMKRIPPAGDFRANFSIGGTVEPFNLDSPTLDLARRALQAADLTLGGVDILIDPDGNHFVLEVNHTPGMIGMELATHQNITSLYLDHVLNHAQ